MGQQLSIKSAETFSGHNSFANSIIKVSKNVYVLTGAIKSISNANYSEVWLAKVSNSILTAQNSAFQIEDPPSPTASAPSTPAPSVPELPLYLLLLFMVVTLVCGAVVRHKKGLS
jgi:hypothetical protein